MCYRPCEGSSWGMQAAYSLRVWQPCPLLATCEYIYPLPFLLYSERQCGFRCPLWGWLLFGVCILELKCPKCEGSLWGMQAAYSLRVWQHCPLLATCEYINPLPFVLYSERQCSFRFPLWGGYIFCVFAFQSASARNESVVRGVCRQHIASGFGNPAPC